MSAKHTNQSAGEISARDFPALRTFLRGYLHQDAADEYGSAEEAARQFCRDADTAQRTAVAEEWERLLSRVTAVTALNDALTKILGSAYLLEQDEVKKISEVLRGAAKS